MKAPKMLESKKSTITHQLLVIVWVIWVTFSQPVLFCFDHSECLSGKIYRQPFLLWRILRLSRAHKVCNVSSFKIWSSCLKYDQQPSWVKAAFLLHWLYFSYIKTFDISKLFTLSKSTNTMPVTWDAWNDQLCVSSTQIIIWLHIESGWNNNK